MRARNASGAAAGSVPSTRTSPASARANPVQTSTVVVLPAPLGPSSASTDAGARVRSSPSTAVTDPYRLTRPATARAGGPPTRGAPADGAAAGRRGRELTSEECSAVRVDVGGHRTVTPPVDLPR